MKPVRFGVIGCGSIHGTHCQAILDIEGAELSALYDIVPERAQEAPERWHGKACPTLEELWPEVDAVCVCVPSGLHAEVGIQAAQLGKHVLVEKPIDVFTAAAEALVATCKEQGVKLGVISQHRFAPEVQTARKLVQEGALGEILQCDLYNKWYRTQAYYDSGQWRGTNRLDGGCLMNQSIHYIDLAQWIMGGVQSVQGIVRTVARDIEVETTALAIVEYKTGALGLIQAATICYPGFAERIEFHGTEGSLILELDHIKFFEADPESATAGKYGRGLDERPQGIAPAEPQERMDLWRHNHKAQIADFVEAIQKGREPFITGEHALEPLKVIRAIYESSERGGQRVAIAPTRGRVEAAVS